MISNHFSNPFKVEPILEVLVGKTLELSVLELMEASCSRGWKLRFGVEKGCVARNMVYSPVVFKPKPQLRASHNARDVGRLTGASGTAQV